MKLKLNKIRQRRIEKNITHGEMAKFLGLSNASNYQKYENGTYKFKADMLPALSKILEVKIDYFFK